MIELPFRRLGRGTILLAMAAVVVLVVARPQLIGTAENTTGTRGLPRADSSVARTAPPPAPPAAAAATPASTTDPHAKAPAPSPEMVAAFERLSARLEANPREVDAWMELGALLAGANDHGRAAEAYAAAVELAPRRADAHAQLGKALLFEGMVHVSRLELERALALDPSLVEANLNLGITYSHAAPADIAAARVAWTRTVELAPDSEAARQAREYLNAYADPASPAPTPAG